MTSSASRNSASFTASAAIKSANGLRPSAYEHLEANQAAKHSLMALSANAQAVASAPTTTFGTGNEPPPSSMQWAIPERDSPFSFRSSGNVGQEIVDANGRVVAWTTGELVAAVICHLLNGNQELLQ